MHPNSDILPEFYDTAAVLAVAISLREAVERHSAIDRQFSASAAYGGMDEFMRVSMRVADRFETWSCTHVDFAELGEPWPYLMEDRFGRACLDVLCPENLNSFDAHDCLRIAQRMRLPIKSRG